MTQNLPENPSSDKTLADMAVEVLRTADGRAKTALGRKHAATWLAARAAGSAIDSDCQWDIAQWARPISADELVTARNAMGGNAGTLLTGGAFTDSAVKTRTDLDDELIASATVDELRKLVDADLAARKHGASHD